MKIPGMRRDPPPRRSVLNEGIVTKSGTGFERSGNLDAPEYKNQYELNPALIPKIQVF